MMSRIAVSVGLILSVAPIAARAQGFTYQRVVDTKTPGFTDVMYWGDGALDKHTGQALTFGVTRSLATGQSTALQQLWNAWPYASFSSGRQTLFALVADTDPNKNYDGITFISIGGAWPRAIEQGNGFGPSVASNISVSGDGTTTASVDFGMTAFTGLIWDPTDLGHQGSVVMKGQTATSNGTTTTYSPNYSPNTLELCGPSVGGASGAGCGGFNGTIYGPANEPPMVATMLPGGWGLLVVDPPATYPTYGGWESLFSYSSSAGLNNVTPSLQLIGETLLLAVNDNGNMAFVDQSYPESLQTNNAWSLFVGSTPIVNFAMTPTEPGFPQSLSINSTTAVFGANLTGSPTAFYTVPLNGSTAPSVLLAAGDSSNGYTLGSAPYFDWPILGEDGVITFGTSFSTQFVPFTYAYFGPNGPNGIFRYDGSLKGSGLVPVVCDGDPLGGSTVIGFPMLLSHGVDDNGDVAFIADLANGTSGIYIAIKGAGPNTACTHICTPRIDPCFGANCGTVTDSCGNQVSCGTCTSPQTCGGGTSPGICGCTPKTDCQTQSLTCGTASDDCGNKLNCGSCTDPQTCGGGSSPGSCGCTPTTCSQQDLSCGSASDGCGYTLSCGSCPTGSQCQGGACVSICTPRTCSQQGWICGSAFDGCGNTLSCGSCATGSQCLGGACVSNCTPTTCAQQGLSCGIASDGCGNTLHCGLCSSPATCGGGGMPGVCGSGSGGASSFSLTMSPASITTPQGTGGSSTVSVTGNNGFTGTVTLSVLTSTLPAGASAVFANNAVATGTNTTLTFSPGSAIPGTYTVGLRGVSGTLQSTATMSWTIAASSGSCGGTACTLGATGACCSGYSCISTGVLNGGLWTCEPVANTCVPSCTPPLTCGGGGQVGVCGGGSSACLATAMCQFEYGKVSAGAQCPTLGPALQSVATALEICVVAAGCAPDTNGGCLSVACSTCLAKTISSPSSPCYSPYQACASAGSSCTPNGNACAGGICGSTIDNCGNPVSCGCTSPATCGGGGQAGLCGVADGGASSAVVLASQQSNPFGIAVDATSVYWVTIGDSSNNGTVMKLPLGGGTPVTLAAGQAGPVGIALDASNVYWTDVVSGTVMMVALGGGTPVTLASGQLSPTGITVDATRVYWTNSVVGSKAGAVMAVALGGVASSPMLLASSQEQPTGIAVDATNLYWTTLGTSPNYTDGMVMSVPLGGGTPLVLASGQSAPLGIAVRGNSVYWTTSGTSANGYSDGMVMTLLLGGNTSPVTLASRQGSPDGIAVDATSVYWTNSYGTVMQVPIGGGTLPVVLASNQSDPSGIAVDATSVYWTDTTSPGTVMKLGLGTCVNCSGGSDPCATNNGGCDPLASCTGLSGVAVCGVCPAGYTGAGAAGCLDINECAVNNGGCDPLTVCTNAPGSFTCGACPAGYTGTGLTGCHETVPPVVTLDPLLGHTDNPAVIYTNQSSLTVTGTATDNVAVASATIVVNGVSAPLALGVGGAFSATVTLAEGLNAIAVTAVDTSGNTAAQATPGVILDSVPPSITIVSPAASGAPTSSATISVTASIVDASPVAVTIAGQGASLLAGGGTSSAVVALGAPGLHSITVTATDLAGNTATQTVTVFLDPNAPVLGCDVASGAVFGAQPGGLLPVTFTIDDIGATTSVFSYPAGNAFSDPRGGGVLHAAVRLTEGTNTFTLVSTNEAGLSSALSRTVLYDVTPPSGAFASPAADSFDRGAMEVSVDATDNLTGVASVTFSVDGGAPFAAAQAVSGTRWIASLDTTALADGPDTISAALTDGAGNASTLARTFTIDNTPPAVAITSPAAGAFVRGTIAVSATASDALSGVASITLLVNGAALGTCPSSPCTLSLDTTTLPTGGFTVAAQATDHANNTSPLDQRTAIADDLAIANFLVSPAQGAVVHDTITLALNVTDPYFQSVTCSVGGRVLGTSTDPHFIQVVDLGGLGLSGPTGSCDADDACDRDGHHDEAAGSACPGHPLADGSLAVSCTATDEAGNTGTQAVTVTVQHWTIQVMPTSLNLRSKSGDNSVAISVTGRNVGSLLPLSASGLALWVPGGTTVPVFGTAGDDVTLDPTGALLILKADRQKLISSISGGIMAHLIDPKHPLVLSLTSNGTLVGDAQPIKIVQ